MLCVTHGQHTQNVFIYLKKKFPLEFKLCPKAAVCQAQWIHRSHLPGAAVPRHLPPPPTLPTAEVVIILTTPNTGDGRVSGSLLSISHSACSNLRTTLRGTQLAQVVESVTLDLGLVSSSPMLGVEPT